MDELSPHEPLQEALDRADLESETAAEVDHELDALLEDFAVETIAATER